MKTKKVRLLLNIGAEDRKEFEVPDPALEGQVFDASEKSADGLLRKGWAVDATDADEKKWTAAQRAAERAETDTALRVAPPQQPKP